MKNVELAKKIKDENPTIPENIIQWAEYYIFVLSARNWIGNVTHIQTYVTPRSFFPEILEFTSFDVMPEKLTPETAKTLKEILFKYGITTRTYNVEYRGELHIVDDEEDIQYYLEAVERTKEVKNKHIAGEISREELDAILEDKEWYQAINPITGDYLPLSDFITVDYFSDLIEPDVRFAVVNNNHIAMALRLVLPPEQIEEIEAKAKEIAEEDMLKERKK